MFVDTTKVITTIAGEPIQCPQGKKDETGKPILEDLTLGFVIVEALLGDDGEKLSGTEKADRFDLAEKFYKPADGLPVKIDRKEAEKIKNLVAKRFSTLITGRTYRMIDTSPDKLPEPKAVEAAE
jgi:hypothetical protein